MLAVAGGKGGCGKTTTTVALARAVARTRSRTTCVDNYDGTAVYAADVDWDMPDLHALAGVDQTPSLAALDRGRTASDAAQWTGSPPIGVLPAPTDDSNCSPSAVLDGLRETERRAAADPARTPAQILLDCPAGAGPDAAAPLRTADRVLLVSTVSPESLQDAAKTAAMARTLNTPVVGTVLTSTAAVPDGVARLLDAPVIATVPAVDEPLTDAVARDAYEQLAANIATRDPTDDRCTVR